ncbi:MAG: hypothetical protein LBV16_04675 [Elusimicrobiota bacterium]|nr:hypothetical protein [Elusimicrobiota bacterium]
MRALLKQNSIEAGLDKIRLNLYEQTKDMTSSEMTAYLKNLSAPILKEYSIHTVNESYIEKQIPLQER